MLKPGDRFGSYRVLRLLGRGGMGTVFLLESSSGALVAVKILDPESSGDHESRRRFLREAELALGVKHQHLVETYDIGEDPDTGLCYILMEYAPGGTLADRIDNGPLAIMDAIRIVYQIASVLELARQKGIVHRDIKPENIMFGADGKAKLSDLGIARGGLSGIQTTMVTHTGMMIGTPAYMAPEQMFDAHNVDVRADIYSLGIVFYEMLAGERPNADDTAVQLMAKAVKGEPIPDVRTLRPEVSAAVAELVSLMCAMKVDERISTPIEVTTALSQIVHGHEVTIVRKRPSVMPKKSAPRGGSSRKVATAVVGMVAVVGIAAFMYFGLNERSSRVSPSVQPVDARTPPSIVIKTNEVVKIVEKVVERTVEKKVESKTTALEPTALPTDVAVVIGCDVSPHGGQNFYVNNVHPRNLSRFGKDARLVPLQFKLTSEVLEKVNLLVLSPSWSFMLDADEQESVRRFAETGGVVLALVGCTSSRPGESHGTTVRLLKQYGATVYDAPGEHSLSVRLVNTLAAYGAVGSEPCTTYASCSADWTPLAVASEDSQKFICAVRQIGAGFLIFAPILYANSSFYSEFPWNKVLSSRLKPVRHPDDSFVGSTLDDAPYEARSSRMRFVSSVVPVEGLRWIAQLDDAAAEILTRKFGAGAFATNSVKNCIVGFLSNSMSFSWENRLKELDAIELKMFNPDPKRHGLRGWAVAEYLEQSISPHRDERYRLRGANVAGYMAAAACDELRSRYSFMSIGYGPVVGVTGQIEAARKHDPDFVRYDAKGNPKAAGTPELNSGEKQQYARGRFFAMLEDLHKRKPDLFVRYHQVEPGWNYGAHSYAAVIDALCTAYGSDLPRRWPDRDGKSLSK